MSITFAFTPSSGGTRKTKYVYNKYTSDVNSTWRLLFSASGVQVALHLQSKWRTRVWCGKYLASLKKKLQQDLEERLRSNRWEVICLRAFYSLRARSFPVGRRDNLRGKF